MRAPQIWQIAQSVRNQIYRPDKLFLAPRVIAQGMQNVVVNGVAFDVIWDFDNLVHDENGELVRGVTEFDPTDAAGQVMVSVMGTANGERPEIELSTTGHEAGHVIFDMPAAVHANRHSRFSDTDQQLRRFRGREPDTKSPAPDWKEWRANEFMGGLLAPSHLLHRQLLQIASDGGFPLCQGQSFSDPQLPVVDFRKVHPPDIRHALNLTGKRLGISADFARVRMIKYRVALGIEDKNVVWKAHPRQATGTGYRAE